MLNYYPITGFFSQPYDRAYGKMLRPAVGNACIVAKRCVMEQELLLTASMKSHMGNRLVLK